MINAAEIHEEMNMACMRQARGQERTGAVGRATSFETIRPFDGPQIQNVRTFAGCTTMHHHPASGRAACCHDDSLSQHYCDRFAAQRPPNREEQLCVSERNAQHQQMGRKAQRAVLNLQRCKPCTSRQLAPRAVSLAALPHARNQPQWLPVAIAVHALMH